MARIRRKKLEENPERQIALGMIVSDIFLRDIQQIYQPDLIETDYILKVMTWCQEYYNQFNTCPGVHIEDIYQRELIEGNLDEDNETLIGELLGSLSDEYDRSDKFNSEYLLKQAESYFEMQNLSSRASSIKALLARGDLEAAQNEINTYKTIARSESVGVDPFTDRDGMRKAFEHASEPLFHLPGAAGKFLDDLFVRDAFVTLLGPEKRGKTWMLIELSVWARRAGMNVAFFSAGDMTTPQLQIRYGIRFTGRSNREKYCKEIQVPVLDCRKNQEDICDNPNRAGSFSVLDNKSGLPVDLKEAPDHVPCQNCLKRRNGRFRGSFWYQTRPEVKPLEWQDAADAGERLHKRWGKKSKLLLTSYPNSTLSISKIEYQLNAWEAQQGFVPDVIIIDYMDLLIPDKTLSGEQTRHWIDQIWRGARRLSQERNCLIISATQSDATSYNAKWLSSKHFSESKTKNAHVTGMITLNQTAEEKRKGVMRLGLLNTREDAFIEKNAVTVLQCLPIGRPILNSYL